ncbi:MAG TPA: RidA family protein [Nitrospirota bacterium]|nr:RidA family protein [Nitrospirota bacterium]
MKKKIIKTLNAPAAIGPYSQAVEANEFVFISGQIPLDPVTGNMAQGDVKKQTRQVLENARAILLAAGCDLSTVVKVTIYLKSMDDFASVNETYAEYFPVEPPARSTIQAAKLPKDASIEMDFIAWKG